MHGSCLCGETRYEFAGEAKFAIQCYCTDCQHISGAGHLPQVAVSADGFRTTGDLKTYSTQSDAGNRLELSFCGTCGSPLFKTTSKMPDVRFLCAGSMADDVVQDPFNKVFEDSRRVWDV